MDNILVCVPLRPTQPCIDLSTQLAINALQWHGRMDVLHLGSHGNKNHAEDLADKFNWARDVALAGGYDAMLIVEADMLPPANTLETLAGDDCDIAYATYCSRRNGHPWLVVGSVSQSGLDFVPDDLLRGSGWLDTKGVGTGCTLIRRSALEVIEFDGSERTPDWTLAEDAERLGLTQRHNLDVKCGHRIDAQNVVYPDPQSPTMHRIDTLPKAWRLTGQYRVTEGNAIGYSNGSTASSGSTVSLSDDVAVLMFISGTIEEI